KPYRQGYLVACSLTQILVRNCRCPKNNNLSPGSVATQKTCRPSTLPFSTLSTSLLKISIIGAWVYRRKTFTRTPLGSPPLPFTFVTLLAASIVSLLTPKA